MIWEYILIGVIGGLVTGVSPCILPVLPVVLAVSADQRRKPVLVATGIALSFALTTLVGTIILHALGLPTATLRWAGVILLVLVGLGMFIPRVGELLERPFTYLPHSKKLDALTRRSGSGFGVGLALGLVYAPCAGPVLAAITVAGATGDIGWQTIALTVSFAAGACTPLFFLATAGSALSQRAQIVRKHRTRISQAAGALVMVLALAIALDAPAALQRSLPDWTATAQEKFNSNESTQSALRHATGAGGHGALEDCRMTAAHIAQDCGEVPELKGLTNWINTDHPIDPRTNKTVTLIDFWAFACINCQRANEHVTKLYDRYKDAGLEVVGVHAPEYAFEHDAQNVARAVQEQGIHYPVAQDNDFRTWKQFNNKYWPAHYLVDAQGKVRQIHEGEGAYGETEQLVRDLLTQANPGVKLPDPVEDIHGGNKGNALVQGRNPETYIGVERAQFFDTALNPEQEYSLGQHDFAAGVSAQDAVQRVATQRYALGGTWTLDGEKATAGKDAWVVLNYRASTVQLVYSQAPQPGKIQVNDTAMKLSSRDGTINVIDTKSPEAGRVVLKVPEGMSIHSFTFG
ncbi:redoxin domain-containing protein [Corynebacterium sp. zg254]|uniref:Redoxin domain-containing protein n=1 Tax=Corynebacterium zhongnanshanii TaxID=2768834 RepID=A0ABQ6VGG8_9CORY|nr:redoxin domain-containing protein [Corynebacterium zhongnanshanii]MCR5913341.1 redoxin domain-containing protein [Corynebacterium sp. zg254]